MKKLSEKDLFVGKWLSVHELVYVNREGQELVWESVRRQRSSMGVIVVAQLKHSKKFILIKQYRPAINGYIISFPAGLGTGDPKHALVELKEETGYVGKIVSISPALKAGASLIDDNAYIVCVEVDELLPINQHPQQELESAEDIQVCLVSQRQAKRFFKQQIQQGVHIASNIWYLFGLPKQFLNP
jgi:ADP-ribose pyrophosphatase